MDFWTGVLWALAPTVLLVALFFFILRAIVHMDRNERRAYAKVEAEERARRGLPAAGPASER
ncbi:MAG: hypothetical protein QM626_12630 [Microbacterium sp.]|uniref:hypothetical protein n=1 Tax=Microbacterium sp. TaxID=51671 RepID=UPI0039E3790B